MKFPTQGTMHMKALGLTLFALAAFCSSAFCADAPPAPAHDCASAELAGQKLDADSVRRVERDWLTAEIHGDAEHVACLLEDDYAEVAFDGAVHSKSDIVKGAAKHKGSTAPIPDITFTGIIVHGTAATAYSVQDKHDLAGKPIKLFFSDSFVFHDGAWHPYFSVNAAARDDLKVKD
jgi:hypothetical protein